ncbi:MULTISPECIES: sugar ABC transporter substrate-binding protein [Arthrobacter]|uniref:Sugar ABC transporter substrate-binding protein n=2 Tax=Arthrobacter TaxID=1663 RepID=A0ABU9KK90_9MICC|nr:sugar ABC transporter substrate-binding protein [Arthrobacter sp. YJM1]MDP5227316.1 sugar ABC transporter substrate-binding protein [Arthrobacter sp. YJM1]
MRKIRKTHVVVAVAGALSAALLAGCSSGTAPAAQSTRSGPVEITFSSWLKGSKQVVEAFNASHPDIKVTFKEVASSKDNYPALTNQVKAGNAPDVVTVEYPHVSEMATQGVLQDISKPAGDFVKSKFDPAAQSLVTFGGATWGVPLDAGVLEFFYREDLFTKYGIEVPKTWAEYEAAAAKVATADPAVRLGSTVVGDSALMAALSWQNGAKWGGVDGDSWKIDVNSQASMDAMKVHQDLFDKKLVWADDDPVLQKKQAAGQMLSVISGAWYGAALRSSFPDQAGKWRVAPLPAPTSAPATAFYGGSTFGISKNSTKADAGVKFIEWMTTDPAAISARIGGTSSTFPINTEANAAAAKTFDKAFFGGQDIYANAAAGLKTVPSGWTWTPGTPTTFSKLADGGAQVKAGKATLSQILDQAQDATVADLKNRGISIK